MTATIDQRARGASLLGVVLSLATVAVLTVVVLRVLDDAGLDDEAGEGGTPVERASAVACQSDVAAVERAVTVYRSSQGGFPATVDDLVAAGLLDRAPAATGYQITLEVVGGQPTGRVLVNGQAGAGACLDAVRTTR